MLMPISERLPSPVDKRLQVCWLSMLLLLLVTPLAATAFGAADNISMLDVARVLGHKILGMGQVPDISLRIVWELRLPRVLLAFIAGSGLAICGYVLQSVTRNPLADPYLFGISAGASFGGVLALTLLGGSWLAWMSLPLGAFVGACLSVLIVLSMAGSRADSQIERLLLSGVAVSFMFGAFTSLLLYFSTPQATASLLFWTLGSFARADWSSLGMPALVVVVALVLILGYQRQILAILGGDETAHTLGVRVMKLRLGMLLLCSLITATLVAQCGGIGFVGLMVPHLLRLLLPGRHPMMLTALAGGLFMVWVDVLARSLLPTQELPVGIITSAIGSVFFLAVLHRRRQY
ncbi:iron ABC transporter permease [Shewanella yunxiaonensis]|uniref:Iron ABC transporter permease n=1 Tax=Shewanella yunxiaonensis TaxID=2829809 RepID=A0ABX7YUQ2_9GAMM|nr:iron ABC transporter permease [Shewanella yunxiaonensis]